MPIWLDFVVILAVLGGSGGILGRLGRVLARLGGLLGRLWPVLKASWRILGRLGCVSARLWRVLPRLGGFWLEKPANINPPAPAPDANAAPSPPAPPLVSDWRELKRSARQALPVIRQPSGPVRSGTIPLQTSPYLTILILRSHPAYNVPRRDKIAKALPVIRRPVGV